MASVHPGLNIPARTIGLGKAMKDRTVFLPREPGGSFKNCLESDSKVYEGLQSLRNIRRMDAGT